MKNSLFKLFVCSFLLVLFSVNSFAMVGEQNINEWANRYIDKELNEWALKNNIKVHFDNFNIEVKENINVFEIKENVRTYVEELKTSLIKSKMNKVTTFSIEDGTTPGGDYTTKQYLAKVENMVPSIGWGHINQKFKATVGYSKITEVELVGISYETGVTLGTWTPNYSYCEIMDNDRTLEVNMNGTINYIWKAMNISTEATFKDEFEARGTRLVEK